LGISAIDWLALNEAQALLPWSELLGNSTLNVGQIAGGVASNIVPASANASASIRIANGTPDEIREILEKALWPVIGRAEQAGANLTLEFAETSYGAQVLDTGVPGLDIAPMQYGTDIPSLPQVEKRYLFGTGTIRVAHTPLEELTQDELVLMAEAYALILDHLFPSG
jgi:acetylornithine deacetylase